MKWVAIILAAAVSLVFARADAAEAADAYEFVTVRPASIDFTLGIFRINVITGQVVGVWNNQKAFSVTVDSAPLPAGEYHLRFSETLDQKGTWYILRFDAMSGRLWLGSGGGAVPITRSEVTAPQ